MDRRHDKSHLSFITIICFKLNLTALVSYCQLRRIGHGDQPGRNKIILFSFYSLHIS